MKNKNSLYLIFNYKNEKHLFFNLNNGSKEYIKSNHLNEFLKTLLHYLKKYNNKYFVIFVIDLGKCISFIDTTEFGNITKFCFHNKIYNITYTDILVPETKIIFKDCAHFLSNSVKKEPLEVAALLIEYHSKLKKKFGIDIYQEKIFSIVGVAKKYFIKYHQKKRN